MLENRLNNHNYKHKGFSAAANDWIIVYYETFNTKKDAMLREKQIKNKKSRNYLLFLISSENNPIGSENPDFSSGGS
jgi:putative endonuclease